MWRAGRLIHSVQVKNTKGHANLPIGRTARLAFEMDVMRTECCRAAQTLMGEKVLDERELDECAQLDDALAQAQRILKGAVRNIMLARIGRRGRRSKAK